MIRSRKSKMHRCTPIREAWLKNAKYLGIPRKSIQRPWPGGPTRKGCRTILCLLGDAFQRLWQGGPPRKQTHQNKIVITRKCISEASARGVSPSWSPKEMLQNKIVLFRVLARGSPRKGSRTRLLLPGNVFQKLWPGGPPREGSRTRF